MNVFKINDDDDDDDDGDDDGDDDDDDDGEKELQCGGFRLCEGHRW